MILAQESADSLAPPWDTAIIYQTQFLGEALDFLGKVSFFNAEIGDTEKCSEPVAQGP